jgi:hypothetical protein
MAIGGVLIGFLYMLLYCAIVIFVAYCIAWAWSTYISPIDANVYKWGKIVVGLLCLIAFVGWLLSLLSLGGGGPYGYFPHF